MSQLEAALKSDDELEPQQNLGGLCEFGVDIVFGEVGVGNVPDEGVAVNSQVVCNRAFAWGQLSTELFDPEDVLTFDFGNDSQVASWELFAGAGPLPVNLPAGQDKLFCASATTLIYMGGTWLLSGRLPAPGAVDYCEAYNDIFP